MTILGSKASFGKKGASGPVKYADFVIPDTDLVTILPEEVLNAKVESTWIGGEKVF